MSEKRNVTIGELKNAIMQVLDIEGFYGQFIQMTKRLTQESSDGWSNRILCPIHNDNNTAAFFINLKTGNFKCHTCNNGGSVFDFWIHMHHMSIQDPKSFREAIIGIANFANFDIEAYKRTSSPALAQASGISGRTELSTGKPLPPKPSNGVPATSETDENDKKNKPIDMILVKKFQGLLTSQHMKYLNTVRGLTKQTIEERMIGFDPNAYVKDKDTGIGYNGRLAIPVFDKDGACRNFRLYSERSEPKFKMLNYVVDKKKPTEKSYGKPIRLYNRENIQQGLHEHIILCGGEFDCILLNQMLKAAGYHSWIAVTGTGGENKFNADWLIDMMGMHVYLCLDCDEPGKSAAANIVSRYLLAPMNAQYINSVRIVELPLDGTKESKDTSDYLLKAGFSVNDLVNLCIETPEVIAGGLDSDDASREAIRVPDFISAIKDRRYIDQRIEVPITVSGVSTKTYHAIREYRVTRCKLMQEGSCCNQESEPQTIPYGHPIFIESCMEKEAKILWSIGNMVCDKEERPCITPTKKVVMEEYFAHQVVERWRAEEDEEGRFRNIQELTSAAIYLLQPNERVHIEPQDYMATGWIRTHPRTCIATFFVEKMVPMEEDWKKFSMKNAEHRDLIKRIKTFETDDLIKEIVHGVTRIFESDEVLYAVLLMYLSPICIPFNGRIMRGWINAAILGDSGTGKSATYSRFSDWVEQGDLFSALSGSRTGLLYAIKTKNGEWHVSVGRYVQASGKALAVDETQEIPPEEIKKMAVAMDTGRLEVARVASGGYNTQTRCLFMMNPKDKEGRAATLSDFSNPCEAIRRIFDPMFIRRLDIAVFIKSDHKYEFYNQKVKMEPSRGSNRLSTGKSDMSDSPSIKSMLLTPKMMRALIHWAWTRTASQVIWEDLAVDECLQTATEMSKIYSDEEIPLVNPQDFRENLARISTSYAILDRSFTDDLEAVIIKPDHVKAMAKYLDMLYSSPACNLRQYAKTRRQKTEMDDFDKVKRAIEIALDQCTNSGNNYFKQCNPFAQILLLVNQLGSVRQTDLAEQIGATRQWTQKRLAFLVSMNLLEFTARYGFRATRKFNLFMQQWMADSKVESMLAEIRKEIGKYSMMKDDVPNHPTEESEENHMTYTGNPFA